MPFAQAKPTARARMHAGILTVACVLALGGCAQPPKGFETASIGRSAGPLTVGAEDKRLACGHFRAEIETRAVETAKLLKTHRSELANPPATLAQVWSRGFGGSESGTTASSDLQASRAALGKVAARMSEQGCPRIDVDQLVAASEAALPAEVPKVDTTTTK